MTIRPPDWFVRRLRAIDRDLRVEYLPREQKWAIMQVLWNTPSLETTTQRLADEAKERFSKQGYSIPRPVLEAMLYSQVAKEAIVMRVENADGTPRDLDSRVLHELSQRAYKVRNWGVKDWVAAMDDLEYEARRTRERNEAALWQQTASDKVFTRILSDTLAGVKMRHTFCGQRPEEAFRETRA